MHLVVIGSGAAGLSAIQAIREHDKEVNITLITKDTRFYSLFSLPFYIAGEIKEIHMDRITPQDLFDKKITLHLGTKATAIKPKSNVVVINETDEISYDALLLGVGALPIMPPIPGLEKEGVLTLANLQDSQSILKKGRKGAKNAVVIGGGFVGIEAAIALHNLGISVTIIEKEGYVLPRMLDEDTATITKQLLAENGVDVLTSSSVTAILGNQTVEAVRVSQKRIPCDLVVVAVGVRPNLELTQGTSIATNVGILVDDFMRTNIQNIFAAGDAAEALDRTTSKLKINAIWPNAIEQGKIAGKNMLGQDVRFEGSDALNLINIFNIPILSIGQTSNEISTCEVEKIQRGKIFRKLLLKKGRVLGYQTIGDLRNAGFILQAHRNGTDISDKLDALRKDNLISQVL